MTEYNILPYTTIQMLSRSIKDNVGRWKNIVYQMQYNQEHNNGKEPLERENL